jgi:hypothetical protein
VTGSIRVVSKRKSPTSTKALADEITIDVDRTNKVLGNPYVLNNEDDPVERERVISSYEKDFKEDLAANGPMSKAITKIANRVTAGERIALRCWCAPRRCHADILRKQICKLAGLPAEDQMDLF